CGRFRYDINPLFAKQTYRAQHIELLFLRLDDIHAFGVIFCAWDSNSGPTDGDIFLAKGAF
ncbi:MAG: hypothetical protein J6S14_20175, partial [Clostridia bacterium]|nr:hypothetical protein [Clostridia bacterium]